MKYLKRILALSLVCALAFSLTACVDQHPEESASEETSAETTVETETASETETETETTESASADETETAEEADTESETTETEAETEAETRIVATSNATLWICDKLGLDLVGICTTTGDIPERYEGLTEIGTAMSPDAEQIALLEPTDVIGPDTLRESIEPTYEAAGLPCTWIDLQSVQGMYDSIAMLGEKYGVQDAADALIAEYEQIMADFEEEIAGKENPTVLVLMGLPGAYIECTPNSYVGSLVELAGATNVVQVDDEMNFVSWNTEELLALDPDVILLTAHGLPEQAMEMFAEEFTTNDIWQHFSAVQNGKVYQLDYETFGMSCTFEWPTALNTLKEILYDGTYASYEPEAASEDDT